MGARPRLAQSLASLCLLAALGCSVFSPRPSLARFADQMLSTREAAGIDGLKVLGEREEAVHLWMVREGSPDYVFIESGRRALLFYIERDEIVRFERPLLGRRMQASASKPIRSEHYMQFANADRERLVRARMGQASRPEPTGGDVLRKRVGGETDAGASTNRDGMP